MDTESAVQWYLLIINVSAASMGKMTSDHIATTA